MAGRVWIAGALIGSLGLLPNASARAQSSTAPVVIGDVDDMSGVYSDIIGQGGVIAAQMAIDDFGSSVLGRKIELKSADHQNKPDIGSAEFLRFAQDDKATMILGGSNSGVNLAMAASAKEHKVPFISIGAAAASLTGKDCNAYTIHYAYDTTSLANGTAKAIIEQGGKSWYFLTADYAFGTQLQEASSNVVTGNGGKVVGAVRAPLGTTDYSAFLLQAQGSGAKVLGLANAGADFQNSLKAAREFRITDTMKPAALLAFITDVHSLGLQAAQGLTLTTGWYWDLNDKTRAFSKRFFEKTQREPTMTQAAYYSATLAYLNAVKAAGTTDADKVMAELHKAKIDDMFTANGHIRPDGLMEHEMYVMQVKTPAESKSPWDLYKLVKRLKGDDAFGSLAASTCPLAKS